MALASTMVWEVRPGSGSDANGGGFDPGVTSPGTDYSQQNSAQFSGTDGTAAGTAAFTSVSHSFVSGDVGNIINISAGSGFTAGFYEITSVAGGTATLDRPPGTGTTATWALGGALNTVGILFNRGSTGYNPNNNYAGTIYMKGTQTMTSSTNISVGGGDFSLIGYGSTRGDNVQATFTISTTDVLWKIANSNNARFYNINFVTTAGTPTYGIQATSPGLYLLLDNCTLNGFSANIGNAVFQCVLINCLIENNTSYGLDVNAALICIGCYFKNNAVGFHNGGSSGYTSATFIGCVFSGGTYAIQSQSDGLVPTAQSINLIGCVIYNTSSDGVRNFGTGTHYPQVLNIVNTIFYSCGGYAINVSSTTPPAYADGRNNAFGNNTSGNRNNYPVLPGDLSLSANPFTSPSTDDFTLNSTSGGGAACKTAGFQSSLI